MTLCIDANVFVAASRLSETHCPESRVLLGIIRSSSAAVICPTLALIEVAAAVARPTGKVDLARFAMSELQSLPVIQLVPLDATRAQRAAELAITLRLRGADAVYAQVAEEFGATLVTWDEEMLQRTGATVSAMTPAQWLASQA